MGAKVCKPQLPCGSGLGRLGVEEPSLGLSLFLSPKQLLPTSPAQQGPPVPRLWDSALMAVIQGWPRTSLPWEGLFIQDTPSLSRAGTKEIRLLRKARQNMEPVLLGVVAGVCKPRDKREEPN